MPPKRYKIIPLRVEGESVFANVTAPNEILDMELILGDETLAARLTIGADVDAEVDFVEHLEPGGRRKRWTILGFSFG